MHTEGTIKAIVALVPDRNRFVCDEVTNNMHKRIKFKICPPMMFAGQG